MTSGESIEPADTESRLREVALDLFGRHGVQGTSTREILKAAGLRNPSAISYHFGSKAGLVEDLVYEIRSRAWPVVELQVDLVERGTPSIEEWVGVAADSAAALVSTERGALLARILWEYDCVIAPNAFEEFLGSDDPLARAWQDGIDLTFRDMPRVVALARNFLTVHMIEWLLNRRAARILNGQSSRALKVKHPEDLRDALFEISMALLSAPSRFTDEDMVFEE
jgi:AcrR family transcriptional regulator